MRNMLVLLILPVWILLLAVVVGLCLSARLGDASLVESVAKERRSPEPAPPVASRRREAPVRSADRVPRATHEIAA